MKHLIAACAATLSLALLIPAAPAGARTFKAVEVRDAAHFVMLDQPAAFAAALDDFLR